MICLIFNKTSVLLGERQGTPPGSVDDGEGEGTGDSLHHQEGDTEAQTEEGHLRLQAGSDEIDWTTEMNVSVF